MAGQRPRIGVLDVLEVLRMALGMDPSHGTDSPADMIAADISGDGRVDVLDAFTVLRFAMGFDVTTPPRWLFLDAETDLSEVRTTNTTVSEALLIDIPESREPELDLTAVLTGHIAGW